MGKSIIQIPSLAQLGKQLADGIKQQVARPNINGYDPAHVKAVKFHASTHKGRLLAGGNRSSKTTSCVVEDIWRAKGEHPYQKVPPAPTRGRAVCVDLKQGIQKILIPEYARWIPPSMLKNGSWEDSYSKDERVITFANGSFIELMSYEQDVEKFAGTSRHYVHFDEEPPKAIFDECKARLIDTGGPWYMAMTPLNGMNWAYEEIYLEGQKPNSSILVIEVDMTDNKYLSPAEITAYADSITDPQERDARIHGKFVAMGGLIFKKWNEDIHVIDPVIPPLDWKWYASMDHGLKNPTSWHWHAVSPDNVVITFDELYEAERIVSYFIRIIHERNALNGRRKPDIYVGDPAIRQRNGETGDSIQTAYARGGIGIVLGDNSNLVGLDKMAGYLYHDSEKGIKPLWYVTRNCINFRREIAKYRWKPYETQKISDRQNPREEPVDKDNHAMTDAKYFMSLLPDLRPQIKASVSKAPMIINQILRPHSPVASGQTIDQYLVHSLRNTKPPNEPGNWQDEHLGGIW